MRLGDEVRGDASEVQLQFVALSSVVGVKDYGPLIGQIQHFKLQTIFRNADQRILIKKHKTSN